MSPTARSLVALILAGALTHSLAGSAAIGVALANGSFRVNDKEVQGNSSLFDGSAIQTDLASSKLRLERGARIELSTHSSAKVFESHTLLEKGAGQLEGTPSYALEARSLRISPADPKAIARVRLDGPGVMVAAVNGPVRVSNAAGLLIAKVYAGRSYRFQPQSADSDSFEVSGCLLKKNGKFIVADIVTSQVFDLVGVPASAGLGNRVTVKGVKAPDATPATGSTAVIQVKSISDVAPGGCLATAANVGADPLPGATTAPPKAGGPANKAVIYGVIIGGGAAAGIAVALASSSKSKSP